MCSNVADALWQTFGSSKKSFESSNVYYSGELSGSIDDDNLELLVREGNAVAVKNCLISTKVNPNARDQVCKFTPLKPTAQLESLNQDMQVSV